jgi:trans-2,3-dihydro-3-hydroxyanthranilate isomerase
MRYEFELVDVFTERPFGGNQLAVLPDARGLTAAQMQAIAREFNFAESAFVLPPLRSGSTAQLRIFAPGAEMPFAGHPTVGSAAVLARRGVSVASGGPAEVVLDEVVGRILVTVDTRGDQVFGELCLEPTLERPGAVPSIEQLAAALTLPPGALVDAWFAGVGVPFAYCRLASAQAVDQAVLDRPAFAAALGGAWARNLFFFAGEPVDGATLYGRMFAPGIGVEEDPATGSACATLAGWMAWRDPRPDVTLSITVQQGVALGRSSFLYGGATKAGGYLRSVTVGGNVAFVGRGHLDVPEAS